MPVTRKNSKPKPVKQVVERGHRVAEFAERLGASGHSLFHWIKRYDKPVEQWQEDDDFQAENRRLKAELKRVSEERDILKKVSLGMLPRTSPGRPTEVRAYSKACEPISGTALLPHDGRAA